MMKKIFVILLTAAFFNMVAFSAFAETDAERDERQQRAVLGCIGLVCFVGALYMLSKMVKNDLAEPDYSSVLKNNFTDNGSKINFSFYNPNLDKKEFEKKEDLNAVGLKFSYSW